MRASLAASTSATVVVPFSPRLRFLVLLVRMCCLNAAPRRNLSFLVRLNRFAAPRCVLSFSFLGMSFLCRRRDLLGARGLRLAAAGLRPPRQDRVHLVAFHPRQRLRDRDVAQLLDEPLEDPAADLGMRHLAAAEEDRRLHLVAVLEEALDVLLLALVVVL